MFPHFLCFLKRYPISNTQFCFIFIKWIEYFSWTLKSVRWIAYSLVIFQNSFVIIVKILFFLNLQCTRKYSCTIQTQHVCFIFIILDMGSGGAQLVEQTRRLSHRTRNDSMSFIEQTIMKKRDFAIFALHIVQAIWYVFWRISFEEGYVILCSRI